jgi:hypothetical protein
MGMTMAELLEFRIGMMGRNYSVSFGWSKVRFSNPSKVFSEIWEHS